MTTQEPKPWLDEDIDERIEELTRERRWILSRDHGVVPQDGGHLVVLHASTMLDMLATIQQLRDRSKP